MAEETSQRENGTCPHTQLSIPECCCRACLEAQIRTHDPKGFALGRRSDETTADMPERRAA